MQNREPAGIAQTVALTFMGTRVEKWAPARFAGLAGFFSQIAYKHTGEWKEEIVFFDPDLATNGLASAATFPDGTPVQLAPGRDPRMAFAEWLIDPANPWFTRNIANRVWSWLLGRGIIHEPDDYRLDNPPSNPELLELLESELVAGKYDLKHLYRLILNSRTYQASCLPAGNMAEAPVGKPALRNADFPVGASPLGTSPVGKPAIQEAAAQFAFYPLRRLEAEVLIDALNQITGGTEKYSSAIPEPFTFIPEEQRSIALPDGSISSSFLEMFGRPPRDTGLESERNNRSTAAQQLHLLNSSQIQRKIEQSRMIQYQMQGTKTPREIATGIYLGILSRFPTEEELKIVGVPATAAKKREWAVDLVWALVNSSEFLYRH
jgi:hypothetical protein